LKATLLSKIRENKITIDSFEEKEKLEIMKLLEGNEHVSVNELLTARVLPSLGKHVDKTNDSKSNNGSTTARDSEKIRFETLTEISPKDLAAQLTLRELYMFTMISPKELLFGCWKRPDKELLSYNVCAIITWFNHFNSWVATEIVRTPEVGPRKTKIKIFIRTAKECHELRNYNTTKEIIAALGLACIQRLKHSWSKVKKSDMETYNMLNELMNHQKNSITYRTEFSACPPPHIPYVGVHLQDLIAIEELPTKLSNGFVNFKKMHKLEIAARPILTCLQQNYDLKPDGNIQKYFSQQQLEILTPDELWERSKQLEPNS